MRFAFIDANPIDFVRVSRSLALNDQVRIVLGWLAKTHEAFLLLILLVQDVAHDVHLCHIVALRDRVRSQEDLTAGSTPQVTHCQLTLDCLIVRRQQLIQVALKVADQVVCTVLIFIKNLDADDLIAFKLVINLEVLLEVWVQTVVDRLSPSHSLPPLLLLSLGVDDGIRVTFVAEVHVDQVTARQCDLDLMRTLDHVHGLCMLLNLVLGHNDGTRGGHALHDTF